MYKKILLPTDGSDSANKAVDYVHEIAKKFNSEVILLHTFEVSDEVTRIVGKFDNILGQQLKDMEHYMIDYGKSILNKIKSEFEKDGIRVKIIIISAKATHEIIKTINNESCDLVVMGSRGLNTLKSILLGSVSNYVIHHTKCPVILIH
jgi:nucleotide-binding universal stress UspA family protein